MIGIIRWVVALVRIDISYEVSSLSRYLVQPHNGHLVQALHMFKYLDIQKDNYLACNPSLSELSDPITTDRKIK